MPTVKPKEKKFPNGLKHNKEASKRKNRFDAFLKLTVKCYRVIIINIALKKPTVVVKKYTNPT